MASFGTASTRKAALGLPPLSRVAVIGGGGPAGLVAIRQLLDKGVPRESIRAFEARREVGGVWNYEADPGPCEISFRADGLPAARTASEITDPGVCGPTPMYDNLHTNLPDKVMALRGTSFPPSTPVFPSHQQAASYLRSYAIQKSLLPLISFSSLVRAVYHTHSSTSDAERWTVEFDSPGAGGEQVRSSELFSHVIITNGHYNEPYIPSIPGLWTYPGKLLHSRWWRNPAAFAGQNVLVIGSRASGSDIARELAVYDELHPEEIKGRRIYQSVRGKEEGAVQLQKGWATRIQVVGEVVRVEGERLVLKDGSMLEGVEAIVFATGYLYSYPFFSNKTAPFDKHPIIIPLSAPVSAPPPPTSVTTDSLPPPGGSQLHNLDSSDIFYSPDPSLSFIGLWYNINPWPLNEITARLIAHSYLHRTLPTLPPLRRMSDDPHDMKIGAPQEFENADAFLEAIGEGGEGSEGNWGRVEEERRRLRILAPELRRNELGY